MSGTYITTISFKNRSEWIFFKKFCDLNGFSLTTGLKYFTRQAMREQNFGIHLDKIK